MFGCAAGSTYIADGFDEPFEIVGGSRHSEDAGGAGGSDLLRGLVVVAAFTADDEVADDLFFVADLPDEAACIVWDLVGVDAEPLWDGVADDGCLGGLGGHCLGCGGWLFGFG